MGESMTDDEKLELLDKLDDRCWKLLVREETHPGQKFTQERLDIIERCQRIRANLRPLIVPSDRGTFATGDGKTWEFKDDKWVECHASFNVVPK